MDRFVKPFSLATVLMLAAAAPAAAQIRPDVTANPNASGTRVLLYPGGQYGRVMRPLLEPGERDPNAPIVLHMPRKHPKRTVQAKPKPDVAIASAAPPPAKAPKPPKTQKPAPSEETVPISALPDESAAKLVMAEPPAPARPRPAAPKQVAVAKASPLAPPKPQPVAPKTPLKQVAAAKPPPPKGLPPAPTETAAFVVSGDQSGGSAAIAPSAPPPRAPAQPSPAPTRTASIETPATNTATTELSKRSSILFTPGAEEPPAGALDTIKGMTASLTAALWSGTAHIQLEAFGGKSGDKSSDARRLSLKRALIVRQLLIDNGIPAERIVVRAMGGASGGALDRVDIFVAA